ncbi:MAG: LCP family protein [Chloroflexota bacterium]
MRRVHPMRLYLPLTCILLLVLPACGFARASQPTPLPTVTLPLDPTATRTPFLPGGLAPSLTPTSEIPLPAESLPRPAGQVCILLLGSDQRPGRSDFRTDVILLLSLRADGSLALVSFPRDLYLYLPGRGTNRINTAFEYGGFELLAETLDYNFGLRPDRYVLTNFDSFMSIVDSLGGVDVNVAQELSDARTGYPEGFTVNPGLVHMDGETALWYVRSRETTTDFDRLRRAQEVLAAIGGKLFSLQALAHIPDLYQAYRSLVVTDLSLEDLLDLLPVLEAVDSNRVDHYTIVPPVVAPWIHPDTGAYYLLPDTNAIRAILQQAIGTP